MDFRNHSSYYIPRPSLNSNSTTSSKSHRSSDSTDIERGKGKAGGVKNPAFTSEVSASYSSSISSQQSDKKRMETCVDETNTPKRGSRSSQGSSDSEQSTHVIKTILLKTDFD